MAEAAPGAVAPVEPVTAEVVTPAPDTTAVPVVEKPVEAEPSPEEKLLPQSEVNKLIQKRERIAASRAEKLAMERFRAEAAERELERLRAERAAPTKQPQGEPRPEDFTDASGVFNGKEFVRALIRWERQQESVESTKTRQVQEDREYARQQYEYVQSRFEEASEKYPDLQERLTAKDMPMTSRMTEYVLEAEHGFDVGNYLADHLDEAKKIARLSSVKQFQELEKIASKLTAPPKPTQTPPPIKPLDGNASAKRDWGDLSTAEHVEKWLKRKR